MKQFNIVIDVLGGWSVDLEETVKEVVGQQSWDPFLESPGNLPGQISVFGDKCFFTEVNFS